MFSRWATALICGACTINVSAQQAPPAAPATGFLAGQVVESPSGKPIAGALVTLIGNTASRPGGPQQRPVVADSQGRFYFANLPVGNFGTNVLKTGYSYPQSVLISRTTALAADEHITDLKITLVKLGAISGTLRDDGGDAVVGMSVLALRRSIQNGRPVMTMMSQARSDDRGVYRISGLPPGAYVVCACGRDPLPFDGTLLTTLAAQPVQLLGVAARASKVGADVVSLDDTLRTFAPTLYPNSATVARADRITVNAGEEKPAVDMTLPAVRAVRVSGTITGTDGPISATSIRLVASGESDEGALLTQLTPTLVQPDGRFDFANVSPGSYTLRVQYASGQLRASGPTGTALAFLGSGGGTPQPPPPPAPPQPPVQGVPSAQLMTPVLWATVPVSVGDRDVVGLVVSLRPGGSVSGKIMTADGAPLPTTQVLSRSTAFVTPLNPPPGQIPGNFGNSLTPEGSFRIPWVVPGRYRLGIGGVQTLPTLKKIEVNGIDMTDLPIDIIGDLTDVVFTMSPAQPASIAGAVVATGPREDLTALVFPADRKLWADPDAAYRRFRASAVSRTGAFTAVQFPAGEYFVAVVPDAQTLDWQEAGRLEALSKTAVKVTLADGDKKSVEVKR